MGDNEHVQPSSSLPACVMARELKILETNLKIEESILCGRYIVAQMTHLKWRSAGIGSYPQWQAKEPQGR